MTLVAAGIVPHPPIIIPEIGKGELEKVQNTVGALRRFARETAEAAPETTLIITPHGPVGREAPVILSAEELQGDFSRFFAPGVRLTAKNDLPLLKAIEGESEGQGIGVTFQGEGGGRLDHGVTVPLYYLQEAGLGSSVVPIAFSLQPNRELFRFGRIISRAAESLGRRIAVVASGDLSHRLTRGAPAGYHPRGKEFDEKLVEYIRQYQVEEILSMDDELVADAGECGLRSIAVLLGALEGKEVEAEVLSYEGPFGVGYMVARFALRQ